MILVTGASGFLGNHLLQSLVEKRVPVRALYNSRKPDTDLPGITWRRCDMLDIFSLEEALEEITQVYHCAAIVSFDSRDHAKMIRDNVAATANLVNALLEKDTARLVHVSSVAALGRTTGHGNSGATMITEETHWEESRLNSAYARSKFLSEMEVWRGIAEGLNAVIVNPSIILGEGDWSKGSAHLMEIVYREFPWYTEGINGWVDVKDVADAMVLLMNSGLEEERFILNAGNYPYREVFTHMAEALKRKPPHRRSGKWMTELVWRLMVIKSRITGRQSTITRETARTAQSRHLYDNRKFLEKFPSFTYRPLPRTIERMAASFLQQRQ